MAVATFDTLKFANTLKAAGVPDKQAEAQAVAFAEVIQVNLKEMVTKDDLTRAIDDLRKDLKHEMKELEQRVNARIDLLRSELTLLKWMIGAVITGIVGLYVRMIFHGGL